MRDSRSGSALLNHALRTVQELSPATLLLTLAQAINLTCAVIAVTISALAGAMLAPTPAWATVPYGAQFASVMLFTYPASMSMRKWGRRPVFIAGALSLSASGVVGTLAMERASFELLVASHVLLGIYIACANFYRFAAVDHLLDRIKARVLSLVVAGGVGAALLGPFIANTLQSIAGFADFSLCYASLTVLGVFSIFLMAIWSPEKPAPQRQGYISPLRSASQPRGHVLLAVLCAGIAYLLMNLLMIQTSLVMKDICSFQSTSTAIQVHVLAMFAPSIFTGALIARIGMRSTLATGFLLLGGAGAAGMLPIHYNTLVLGLLLLGLGWNLVYVGAGALLAQSVRAQSRHRWQGINDTLIAACATLGALSPAPLLAGLGSHQRHRCASLPDRTCAGLENLVHQRSLQ